MLRNRAWRALVERYISATVSPLAGFPAEYTAWAYEAFIDLKVAIKTEEARQDAERRRLPSGGVTTKGPSWRPGTRFSNAERTR